MNHYGYLIRDRWKAMAPASYAAIENHEQFFDELGEIALTSIASLSDDLVRGRSSLDYLTQVAILGAARKQAEELALDDVPWPKIEMTPDETREEWESTRSQEVFLANWMSYIDRPLLTYEIDDLAVEWLLPPEFLREMSEAMFPGRYLDQHPAELAASQEARFARYLRDEV